MGDVDADEVDDGQNDTIGMVQYERQCVGLYSLHEQTCPNVLAAPLPIKLLIVETRWWNPSTSLSLGVESE